MMLRLLYTYISSISIAGRFHIGTCYVKQCGDRVAQSKFYVHLPAATSLAVMCLYYRSNYYNKLYTSSSDFIEWVHACRHNYTD